MIKRDIYLVTILLVFIGHNNFAQSGNKVYQYALIEAVKQKNLGNIPGAIELYKMVVKENDSVAIAYFELGSLYLIANQPEIAENNFYRAYNLDVGNEWYFSGYVDVLIILKKYKEAEELVKSRKSSNEKEIEYKFSLANIYFLEGNSKKAIRTLDLLEKNFGVSDKIILLKANIFEEEKKYKSARNEIDKLIEFFPESLQFYVVAAELALKENNKELANRYYSEVLELDSTNIYALTNLTDYYRLKKEHKKSLYYLKKSFESDYIDFDRKMAILSYYLGDSFFRENYSAELLELLKTVMEKHPDKKDAKLYTIDFYIQIGEYENAFNLLKPLLVKKEVNYELWRQGILLSNALSKKEDLLVLADKAISIFPDSAEILYFKGIAEYENEMYENVVITFSNPSIAGNKNTDLVSQTKQILAESLNKLEKYEQSDSLFRVILKEEPRNYMVMNNFSYYLALREESLEEAKSMSYITITDNPENGTFLDTYAWILFKMGDFKEAEKFINKALQKGGLNDPDVNEHAGEIHENLKSYVIARSFYEKAIILGGDKIKLEKKLMELENLNEK